MISPLPRESVGWPGVAALGPHRDPVTLDALAITASDGDVERGDLGPDDGAPPADPPRPTTAPVRPLARRLRAPLAVFALLQLVLTLGDKLPSVDGTAYFEAGRNLMNGNGFTRHGGPELHFPPLTPVAVGVLEKVTGSELAALRIWNVLCATFVLAILVALARRLWHDDDTTVATAWFAGTMAGLAPLFVRQGGGSESIAMALLLSAALLAIQAFGREQDRRGRLLRLAASGLAVGLAYLARPESMLPGAVVGFGIVLHGLTVPGSVVARLRRAVVWGLAFGLLFLACAVPYLAYLHSHTGHWSATAKNKDASIQAWRAVAENDRLERDRVLYAIDPSGTSLGVPTRSLTALAREDPKGWLGIVGVNLRELLDLWILPGFSFGPAWRLVPAFLLIPAGAAVWAGRRRRSVLLLTAMGLVPIATTTIFFVLPRYLVLPTAVVTLFAARGLTVWLRGRTPRVRHVALAVTIVFMATSTLGEAKTFMPFWTTNDPIEQAAAGRWIDANTPEDARIMTRSFHVQAYAHRPVVALPSSDYAAMLKFARRMGVSYVVADEATISRRRPELYPALMTDWSPPGLKLVKSLTERGQEVRIYRLDPLPPASDQPPIPLGYVSD